MMNESSEEYDEGEEQKIIPMIIQVLYWYLTAAGDHHGGTTINDLLFAVLKKALCYLLNHNL